MNVNVDLMKKNVIQVNGGTTIDIDVSVKQHNIREKDYIWNPATCSCENKKYLTSIMDDSAIHCRRGS